MIYSYTPKLVAAIGGIMLVLCLASMSWAESFSAAAGDQVQIDDLISSLTLDDNIVSNNF